MKRVLSFIIAINLISICHGQDFASKFISTVTKKDLLHCQTISPKMMEKLVKMPEHENKDGNEPEDSIIFLLSKLKSARIVTSEQFGKKFFKQAVKLIETNKNRFAPLSGHTESGNSQIFVRKHEDTIIELVMLNYNSGEDLFTIINFTGAMDNEFIRMLSKQKKEQD